MSKLKHNRCLYACWGFIAIYFLIGFGFWHVNGMVQKKCDEKVGVELDYRNMDSTDYELSIEMKTSGRWKGKNQQVGAQYDGLIYNNSDYDLSRWVIEIQVPEDSFIDSSWNGVYTHEGKILRITPVEYNQIIKKHTSETSFGFVMYTLQDFEVESLKVWASKRYEKEDFKLYCILWVVLIGCSFLLVAYILIEIRIRKYRVMEAEDKKIIVQSLKTFANFVDARDSYTKGHSTRVAIYTREMARRMGLKEHDQDIISYIALLHDVGKIGIRDDILQKPEALTEQEWKGIQMHTQIGAYMLKDFTAINGITDGAMYHHERYDGSGYPEGLSGEEIPLNARMICIADAYDAMASNRCYRSRLKEQDILTELSAYAGKQFDPVLVEYMIEMIEDGFTKRIQEEDIYIL